MNPAILCWEQEAKPTEYILCDVIYVKFNIKQNESMMMAKKRKRWPVKRERWPAGLEGMKGAWETVNVLALSFGLHRCKAMAPHSSTLAWKIPWMEESGRLQSMGSLRVEHDWATSLSLFTFMHWRRKWQPTPVFLPGESQGWGILVGCHLWGHTESDTTEVT